MLKMVRKLLLEGLIVVIPLYLTYRFVLWALSYVYNGLHFSIALIPKQYRDQLPIEILVSIATGLVVLLFVFLCGVFAKTIAGRASRRFVDRIMTTIPVIKSIYSAFNDLFELTMKQDGIKFSKVVYVANPNKNSLSIGFVTGESIPEISDRKKMLNIFIPGTPNPTSGFLVCVPEKEVIQSAMTIEQGMKLVVSGGVVKK